jgi:iron complex outermembrane recepter protein
MNSTTSRFAALLGSASFLTLTTAINARAQQMAPAMTAEVPEQVLVTGSLIHGAAAVGVPITNLGVQDFAETGDITISDLFRTIPQAIVAPGPSATVAGGQNLRPNRVNIRGLDSNGPRSLLMVDGIRFPPQDGLCVIDPSIIPALALDRVDILPDGASATYGSDAIAGVINVVLKRGFDGGVTLLHVQTPDAGGLQYQASQLWGRTWDGGDITLTYEWTDQSPVHGTSHSKYTINYTPWGLDDPIPIGASVPGTISIGKPSVSAGTNCTNCWAVPHGAGANFNPINNGIGPLTPGSASTIDWTTFSANAANMGTNEIDPLKQGWEVGAEQRNSAVATFDQRLFPGISFFATGFYNNRRVEEQVNPYASNGFTNEIRTFAVPTTNPYYPANAPGNLQVSYDFALERPPIVPAYEIAARYALGLNLDLPFNWTGQIYDSRSVDNTEYIQTNVNDNAVSVALGNTVGGVTKPAAVPYMNLFCDPAAFTCNSPQTLSYISANRLVGTRYSIEEKGGHFDGPLFDLPAGRIKAAVGGTYESDNVLLLSGNNVGSPPQTPLVITYDSEPYTVWAGFAQLDVPVFGDNFNFPLLRNSNSHFEIMAS